MNLSFFSDIHTDHHADEGRSFCDALDPDGIDVLIVAGDFCSWKGDSHWQLLFSRLTKFERIIYVMGNHEFWGAGDPWQMKTRFAALERQFPNVTILHNAICEIEGQRFIGGTMWFSKPSKSVEAKWSDFRRIKDAHKFIRHQHLQFQTLIEENLGPDDVVITHHLPSYLSVHPMYAGDPTNSCYVTQMDDLIVERQPKIWLHGHTHKQFDYNIGKTRVVCNPLGYTGELDSLNAFQDRWLIEV